MKIYIAGKITGYPEYKERFDRTEEYLRSRGHTVLNPTCRPTNLTMEEYQHIEMAMIDVCDAVYLMDNFEDSKGALYEEKYAMGRNKMLMYESKNRPCGRVNTEKA